MVVVGSASVPVCGRCGVRLSRYNSGRLCSACTQALRHERPAAREEPWLWVGGRRPSPPDGSNVGELLKAWREAESVPQVKLAELLGWTQPYVSQIETGHAKIRTLDQLWLIHRTLGIPCEELGLLPDRSADGVRGQGTILGRINSDDEAAERVLRSQREWRMVRQYLDHHRRSLTDAAAEEYPDAVRLPDSPVIAAERWLLDEPRTFDDIGLAWLTDPPAPVVVGTESESANVRPLTMSGERYERYSRAMRDLARPALFENRPGYRLLDVDWSRPGAHMLFGYTSYFESIIDVSTALAHEFAAAALAGRSGASTDKALPFRVLVGNPFDLAWRAVLPSINTLTIRRGPDGASFLLHYRDPAAVASASSLYHVMPAGVFQPSSITPWHQANDFSLWRSSMREYAEEFLNVEEADGSSAEPLDYEGREPYRSMELARQAGRFTLWCFGVALDPLTLCGELLSVAIIDAEVFDTVFAGLVLTNQEGNVVTADPTRPTTGIPFTEAHVRRLLDKEPLAGPAAACLSLAWRHRALLLE
jgi:transcriptional regulator with XRE-family HTH domain